MSEHLFDRAGRPPRTKGLRYPADPPTIEEIVAVMRAAGGGRHARRLRALIVALWRGIHEALALSEPDLDRRRGALLVRRGEGGRRRKVGMDEWAWEQLRPSRTGEVPVAQEMSATVGSRDDRDPIQNFVTQLANDRH